jgi:hypothetical protein
MAAVAGTTATLYLYTFIIDYNSKNFTPKFKKNL